MLNYGPVNINKIEVSVLTAQISYHALTITNSYLFLSIHYRNTIAPISFHLIQMTMIIFQAIIS